MIRVFQISILLSTFASAAPVPPKLTDVLEPLPPSAVKLGGFLGERASRSASKRLLSVDEDDLLNGYRQRPGRQAWIGEHVGKFLHAATLAWANNGDAELREKIDRVALALMETQEADGYLGTYREEKRFGSERGSDWDVWAHKYNLIGLLTYHQFTGDEDSLAACRKMGDLLVRPFGPGKKSLLAASTHGGMAATSVLEPMVQLYRATGETKYLDFGRYAVESWSEPGGPEIIKTLTEAGKVNETANGKAYEMLSNLVGLCELARATGEVSYLDAPKRAWADIVENQLYVTGTASYHEHFGADGELPRFNSSEMGETCVTTTWIQLNWQLLRLTGEAKYGAEIERAYYNHLTGAQRPDGTEWCYYTPLQGVKPYGDDTSCCLSSGPRALALLPQMAFFKKSDREGESLVVNLLQDAEVDCELNGRRVSVGVEFANPQAGEAKIDLEGAADSQSVIVRKFDWMIRENDGEEADSRAGALGWTEETIGGGEPFRMRWVTRSEILTGKGRDADLVALKYGPSVLALDAAFNPDLPPPRLVTLAENARAKPVGEDTFKARIQLANGEKQDAIFVPFARAGATDESFAVWLRAPGHFAPERLFMAVRESRSREGHLLGSIHDGETATFVMTADGTDPAEDWFAVEMPSPVMTTSVIFAHGRTYHNGGWFDASSGKPEIQVRRSKDGEWEWESVGELASYPETTSKDHGGLIDGEAFTFTLPTPRSIIAVRVIGKPASGDGPEQAFASCGELRALAE